MPLRIPIAFPTPSLCFWCTLHFPLTKFLSLAAGSCSPAQLVPGFIDPSEESDINPCCVFSGILDSYCILSPKMFAILPLDFKSTTYSIGMVLNLCFHPNTDQHRAEDRSWEFDKKKKSYSTLPLKLIKQGPVAMGCQPFHVSLHPAHSSLGWSKWYHGMSLVIWWLRIHLTKQGHRFDLWSGK